MSQEVVFRPIQPTDSKDRLAELVTAAFTKLEKYGNACEEGNNASSRFPGPKCFWPILGFPIAIGQFQLLNWVPKGTFNEGTLKIAVLSS